jgi:hypothetical protein
VNKILNRKQEGWEINCLETQRGQISHPTELAECFQIFISLILVQILPKISIMVTEISRITSRQQLVALIFKQCLNRTYKDLTKWNYRPISILPVVSNWTIWKSIIWTTPWISCTRELLSPRQFGFKKLHSTASALLDSTNEWFINMDRGLFNRAVFQDLQKAFDTINSRHPVNETWYLWHTEAIIKPFRILFSE